MAVLTGDSGLLASLYPHYLLILSCVFVGGYILLAIRAYFRLRYIPGPTLAAFSNLPRLSWVISKRSQHIHQALHAKYGPLVRLGPNAVSVGDPEAIPDIYTFTGKFPKSSYYSVLTPYSKGKTIPMMFATQDEGIHRMLRKPVAGIYSMTNMVSFERFVDSTMDVFFRELDSRFIAKGESCDFSVWLQRFAFDVMGEITFSKRLGFLEQPEKVGDLMNLIWLHFSYASMVSPSYPFASVSYQTRD